MYYLYKKSKSVALPNFAYTFAKFADFYEMSKVLTMSLIDSYFVRIKSDSYKEIMEFIEKPEESYPGVIVYVETSQSLIDYITLSKPSVSLLSSKSNYETFTDLVSRYGILFSKGCVKTLYFAIDHEYSSMVEALELIIQTYPDVSPITEKEIANLFIVDKLIYPRSVCIMFLRLDRGRYSNLRKCISYFGNDLVLYAIRKNVKTFLDEKIKYLKTGQGSGLIKTIPTLNIVRLYNAINSGRRSYKDITTILYLYEKGVTVDDTLQERTVSLTDAEYNVIG